MAGVIGGARGMPDIVVEPWEREKAARPSQGRQVIAQYTDDAVLVYQAYRKDIGMYAAEHGYFEGAPGFLPDRMTWIKPNFLWMMYRSGWGMKKEQEVTLGVWLKRDFFDELLATAGLTKSYGTCTEEERKEHMQSSMARLQWDPDRSICLGRLERRAVQLGMKQEMSHRYATSDKTKSPILGIVDLSTFAEQQRCGPSMVPRERVYPVAQNTAMRIGITKSAVP